MPQTIVSGVNANLGPWAKSFPAASWGLIWQAVDDAGDPTYRRCANLDTAATCNWLVGEDEVPGSAAPLCASCRLTRTLPDLGTDEGPLGQATAGIAYYDIYVSENGGAFARWLEQRPEVSRVIHPALESHPQHGLWKRDFLGASGLFAIELKPYPRPALQAFFDGLALFGMGASWGGFESLIIPFDATPSRTATKSSIEYERSLRDVMRRP